MIFDDQNFDTNPNSRVNKIASFTGLENFTRNLEKYFFSQISVRDTSPVEDQINLVIELKCDLALQEMLNHYSKGVWGNFNHLRYSLLSEINELEKINNVNIDVDEFSIILRNTTVIIDRIYNHSISNQLDNVFDQLVKHYTQYTRENTEVPYEIFVAVFEENITENVLILNDAKKEALNYSSYWALYFESEEDAVIYDLDKSTILHEDLRMFNQ